MLICKSLPQVLPRMLGAGLHCSMPAQSKRRQAPRSLSGGCGAHKCITQCSQKVRQVIPHPPSISVDLNYNNCESFLYNPPSISFASVLLPLLRFAPLLPSALFCPLPLYPLLSPSIADTCVACLYIIVQITQTRPSAVQLRCLKSPCNEPVQPCFCNIGAACRHVGTAVADEVLFLVSGPERRLSRGPVGLCILLQES